MQYIFLSAIRRKIDNHLLHTIAMHPRIQSEWKKIAKDLNLQDDEITALESDYSTETTYEKSFQMLYKWKRRVGHNESEDLLYNALTAVGVNLPDLG